MTRCKGKIIDWKDERGFGFIGLPDRKEHVFFHIKALAAGSRRPALRDEVSFDLTKDKMGRLCAANVVLARGRLGGMNVSVVQLLLASAFIAGLVVAAVTDRLPVFVAVFYVVMSGITWKDYSIDKKAAMEGEWRTTEMSLQWLALLGGWPGALLAQQLLRHKSKKRSFRAVFWVMVALNLTAFVGLLSSDVGREWLYQIDHFYDWEFLHGQITKLRHLSGY